jgi:Uma2 family endonuclease
VSRILSITDNHIPPPLIINVEGVLTGEQFDEICRRNRDMRLELTSTGELIAMPPTGPKTGIRNANLTAQLTVW